MDTLKQLFEMQTKLNNYIFEKQGLKDENGNQLYMETLIEAGKSNDIGVNSDTKKWISNNLTALKDESRELKDELPWKWWSNDKLDMQNIRLEVIDQLHFWLSIAMSAGMNEQDVLSIYIQKNKVNLERQDKGYNANDKTEDDNKSIHSRAISDVTEKSCGNCKFAKMAVFNNPCDICFGSRTEFSGWQPTQENIKEALDKR